MHKLLKQSVSIAAAGVMLSGMVIGAAAQDDDGGDGALTAIPLPEECLVDPRDEADVAAVLESGEHQFVLPDGLPVPLGDSANAATKTEATEVVRELVACLNAGDALRGAALFSDNGLRGFYGPALNDDSSSEQAPGGTPTARTEDEYLRLRAVTDASVLADGRIAAFVLMNDPLVGRGLQTLLFVFAEDENGGLIIDGTVGFSVLAPVSTPTP